jgi:hypothetical protein
MHNWPQITLAALLLLRVVYAVGTNGRPIYEASAKKGVAWVAVIFVLMYAGGFWK